MGTVIKKLPLDIDYSDLITPLHKATYSIGKLDGLLRILPNPSLLMSPLTTKEATLSSKIEGTQSSLSDVYKFEAGEATEHSDVAEVVNYRKALEYGIKEIKTRPLDLELIREIHKILLTNVRGQEMNVGNFRTIQNWIGKKGTPIEKARYIPPTPQDLNSYLENITEYFSFEEKDPLVQAGIIHAQFESVHPFIDGNGRIGRLLVPLFLFKRSVLTYPVLYISEYFENNRTEYYDKLFAFTEKDARGEWLKYFLTAVNEQSEKTQKTIYKTMALYEDTKHTASSIKSPYALLFVDLIFKRPIFSRKVLETNLNTNRTTVLRMINTFTEKGIIQEIPGRQRGSLYRFGKLFDLINNEA
jgi:Fic family protein